MSNEMQRPAVAADKKDTRRSPFKFYTEEKDGKKEVICRETSTELSPIHNLVGTPNMELAEQILKTGTNALPDYMGVAHRYNLITQNLADYAPQDANEARLATQAAVLHEHGLEYLKRARSAISDDEVFAKDHWHTIFMKAAAKVLDLHNKTIDTLTRYRQRGEQKIVVQHVNVEDGGKAIVAGGDMSAGGGG